MSRFELLEPESLEEALALMAREGEDVPIMAGGVALMILIKQRIARPKRIISLRKLDELRSLSSENGTRLRIGALVTHRAIETSPVVQEKFSVFAETEHHVANVRIRNMGTIGGELSHGDPHSDPAPVLVGLGASIHCIGPGDVSSERTIPMDQFFVDYMETALRPGELLAEIIVPEIPEGLRATYLKHATSTSTDWPALGVAAFGQAGEEGQMKDVRIVVGSVESTAREIPGVSDLTAGKSGGPGLFREVGEYVTSQVEPIDDGRASPWYKKELIKVYVRRALERIWTAQ
ncbi:MAG: xanthine dehydrogenase family protein subunit M [Nitrospinota bacterium]|jgi:carbon-monoxide dehydrogenase medium subunit|nr:xanthine dehydrogenase family protein subunit M [Nitrospinota bacterium]